MMILQKQKRVLKRLLKKDRLLGSLLDPNFHPQNKFILDPSRLKGALCTRRAGKSRGLGIYFCREAELYPGCVLGYLSLTAKSAKRIMFPILRKLSKEHKLKLKFNEIELTVKWPNGSILYAAGIDAKPDEIEKFLGQAYRVVGIDECASFRQDLRNIIYDVLQPAMTDHNGTIVLIGTARNNRKNLFCDITEGREPGWSVHKWSALENPHVSENFKRDMDALIARNPDVIKTPRFKQMWLGEWAIDDSALVYKFSRQRNVVLSLPDLKGRAEWYYVLGVDLGFSPDPSAFVVGAYNVYDSNLYIVETFKKTEMDLTDVANKIKYFQKRYPIHKIIIDNASKQAVEEMKKRKGLSLTPAEKHGKVDFINVMNDDFLNGRIKLVESCINDAEDDEGIADEWETLVWDEKKLEKGEREEAAACQNHYADAALYMWRYCYNYLAIEHEPEPDRNSDDYAKKVIQKEIDNFTQREDKPWWEKDFS